MPRTITLISLIIILLALAACSENHPEVDWELTIDGDVNQPVTYTYQDLVGLRRAKLTDILTLNPENLNERTSWEGVTLFLLLRDPGGVQYSVQWWVQVTLADGNRRRINLSSLRGALIALKDGDGNWLADTGEAPIRLIAPTLPSSDWLDGPLRITVHGP
jgi:DMSO/TMAO reductase YedYZ molybdopterin-dependent catalytic subunit